MSAPVDSLKARLLDATEPLAELMAPAITLATMVRHRRMAAWIRREYEGYAPETNLPGYRYDVRGQIVARSPQYGWIPAPVDRHQLAQFGRLNLYEGVAALERTCMNGRRGNSHRVALPPAELQNLQQKLNLSAELAINLSRDRYCDIIRTIRGTLYLWTLEMADAGLTGNLNSSTTEELERAARLDQPDHFWREAMVSLQKLPIPAVREAGFLERMFGRVG